MATLFGNEKKYADRIQILSNSEVEIHRHGTDWAVYDFSDKTPHLLCGLYAQLGAAVRAGERIKENRTTGNPGNVRI